MASLPCACGNASSVHRIEQTSRCSLPRYICRVFLLGETKERREGGKTGCDFPLVAINPHNPLCTLLMNTHCLGVALGQITQLWGTGSAEYKEKSLDIYRYRGIHMTKKINRIKAIISILPCRGDVSINIRTEGCAIILIFTIQVCNPHPVRLHFLPKWPDYLIFLQFTMGWHRLPIVLRCLWRFLIICVNSIPGHFLVSW